MVKTKIKLLSEQKSVIEIGLIKRVDEETLYNALETLSRDIKPISILKSLNRLEWQKYSG